MAIFLLSGCGQTKPTTPTPPKTGEPVGKEIPYKIIEEDDISYAGCKRAGIRIVVPDDADKNDVDFTMAKITSDKKASWDDITIWAFKYSEESKVGTIPYTMGMKEYSTCQ